MILTLVIPCRLSTTHSTPTLRRMVVAHHLPLQTLGLASSSYLSQRILKITTKPLGWRKWIEAARGGNSASLLSEMPEFSLRSSSEYSKH